MTVFFVNEPMQSPRHKPRDITPALEFGEIKYVFTINDESPSRDAAKGVAHAEKILENFDPLVDHIAWAGGDPYSLVVVSAVLAAKHEQFSYLTWDRTFDEETQTRVGQYLPLATNT